MPHIVRIRKRTVVTQPRKKSCHCIGKKHCKYPAARRGRRKINHAKLRKWNTRAHSWVARGRGLLNPTQKANWNRFRAGFREGFHKVLDPITQFATPFISMIPGEGPMIAAALKGINALVPR